MNSLERAWFIAGFTALPLGVLVVGLLVLRSEPGIQAWVRYMWMVVLAAVAWVLLMKVQGGLPAPSRDEDPNLDIFYALWQFLSLAGIVVVGGFWTLVGRAAAVERETRVQGCTSILE